MKTCKYCENPIVGRTRGAMFCSIKCKENWHSRARHDAAVIRHEGRCCESCGGPITSSSGKARTCSKACSVKWQNDKRRTLQLAAWNARKQPCPRCGKEVPESRWRGGVYCSEKCKARTYEERWRVRSPGYNRLYLYGLEPAQYDALLAEQDGRCAICRGDDPHGKGTWHVDHDHATGVVRGLLCHNCNLALGNFRDDPVRLRAAVAYLER